MADDGRIHTTFNQLIAATGRLSSTEPNLQNIPIRTEEGRRIREGFIVGDGYECLMTADYSQIEMRIMADLSEDAALIEAFRSGRDFHSITAAAGLRRAGRRRHPRAARQDQGDELRPRLRPVGLRPRRAAAHPPERGAGADGRVLRDVRRRPRLPRRAWSTRPAARATPRRSSAAAATSPTSPPTTASAARWPSGWPSTPRSRAPPPTSSRSPCSACDAGAVRAGLRVADAAPGPRRARLRGLPRRARDARGAGPRADGRRGRPGRPSRRVRSAPATAGTRPRTDARPHITASGGGSSPTTGCGGGAG